MIKLSENDKRDIMEAIESLPGMMGKIIITFEIGCGMGGVVNDINSKCFFEKRLKKMHQQHAQ